MTSARAKAWSRPAAVAALVLFACGMWALFPRSAREVKRDAVTSEKAPAVPIAAPLTSEPAYSPLADELHAERFDAAHDLVVLRDLIGQFTTTLRLTERPPLGDNADITAALIGKNRRRVVFVPAEHRALREGLLVDRQGTPYHFHARAADAIDVRSAGADRVLFTEDDLVSSALSEGTSTR